MTTVSRLCFCALTAAALAASAQATLVTFTGGNVVLLDATTTTTNTVVSHSNVDYYEEGGFRLDFLPNSAGPAGSFVGAYYGGGNDVIHAHWESGGVGSPGVNLVRITKIGGGTFDLNYFTLTSNTATGGGPANGLEQAYIQGYLAGNPTGAAFQLPSENWGFPATQVACDSTFNVVDEVVFFATNDVDCFGMDDFYIDQIPSPAGLALAPAALVMMSRRRRRA
jgi:hypothetical protein